MNKTTLLLLLLLSSPWLYGHEGHGHAPTISGNEKRNYFSSEASSAKFEVLVTHEEIQPDVASEFKLFLSDFISNLPLDSAEITISSPDDNTLIFEIHREQAGIYIVSSTFPEAKKYHLHVAINHKGVADLIAIPGIDVGQHLTDNMPTGSSGTSAYILLFTGGILLGIIAMLFFKKISGNTKAYVLLSIVLFDIAFGTQPAFAHGGEDHSRTAANPADIIYIPKETQFLFGISTLKTIPEEFTPQSDFPARIVPASSGQSIVKTSQDGLVISVGVTVGQFVKEGQLLAVIDPIIDAASMVGFTADHNAIRAEYESARKEYERVLKLDGIASTKETEEATSRFLTAQANLKLLDDLAAGSKDPSQLIYLRSPISGTLEYFTLTKGASVSSGEALFTITNLHTVYAEVIIYPDDHITPDSTSLFTVTTQSEPDQLHHAKFLFTSAAINPGNQTRTMLIEVENDNEYLKIGQLVNVSVGTPNNNRAITVPEASVSEINGKHVVFTKISAEQFAVRYITPGQQTQSSIAVAKGLESDERIANSGTYQLKTIYLTK